MRALRWLVLATCTGAAAILGGCGTLYSETRDKQGKASKEAWEKVDLGAQVAVPRKNHANLLANQLELATALANAVRDQHARSIATGGTVEEKISKPVRDELAKVASAPSAAEAWLDAVDREAFGKQALRKSETEFRRFGVEMPPCDKWRLPEAQDALTAWRAAHPTAAPAIFAAEDGAKEACKNPDLNAARTLSLPSSELQGTRDQVVRAVDALTAIQSASLNERNRYRAAKAEYEAAAAALKVNPSASRDKVQAAAKRLQEIVGLLAGFQDAFSVRFVSREQEESLNRLLGTIIDTPAGQTPAADASRAAVALVLLPDLIDSARSALADAQKPNLLPFILAKELAQIRADTADRDVTAHETRIGLLHRKLQWQTERARSLRDASINLDGFAHPDGKVAVAPLRDAVRLALAADALAPLTQRAPAADAAAKATEKAVLEEKTRLWKASALYLDATGRLKAEVAKIDYQVNALEFERALTYAESNIAQWNTLIKTSVDQSAAFGASGLKKDDIVGLLNSLTLLWIGKGVN